MTEPPLSATAGTDAPYHPSLKDLLLLELPREVRLSPDGSRVAVLVRTTNWNQNRYDNTCHLYDTASGTRHVINRTGCVTQMEWVDERTLALLKEDPEAEIKGQVWLYEGLYGEGWPVTEHEGGVEWFKPFGGGILFLARDPARKQKKEREARFGEYVRVEQEESASALYFVGLDELRQYTEQGRTRTEEEAAQLVRPQIEVSRLLPERLAIRTVIPAPARDTLYLNCRKRDDEVWRLDTSTYRIGFDARAALEAHLRHERARRSEDEKDAPRDEEEVPFSGEVSRLHLPLGAAVTAVSPDGGRLLVTHQARDNRLYTQADLWVIDAQAALDAPDDAIFLAGMRNISAPLDRLVMESYWTQSGIYGWYVDGTHVRVARFGEQGEITPLDFGGLFPLQGFDVTEAGEIGFVATNAERFPELYVARRTGTGPEYEVRALSDYGRATRGWDLGTVETIRWTSKDGTEIEGVLRTPTTFDPAKRYPLAVVVHGGPRWYSAAYLLTGYDLNYYPAVQFTHEEVLVLSPNYRGSVGRGQAFAELNVDNLGVGDLWDLESAIEHLVELGMVDPERVGCMGWSQGGYIAAFAALHSDRFRAVSVGAGVSDWYTYHIANDVPFFTSDYLSSSPFRDREPYLRSAPIRNIASARTPMLIQHGAQDRRVPLASAMELYRGLQEMGVAVELFVFPGMSHSISKPRENHAVMHQNLAWFRHYLLDEPLELE